MYKIFLFVTQKILALTFPAFLSTSHCLMQTLQLPLTAQTAVFFRIEMRHPRFIHSNQLTHKISWIPFSATQTLLRKLIFSFIFYQPSTKAASTLHKTYLCLIPYAHSLLGCLHLQLIHKRRSCRIVFKRCITTFELIRSSFDSP